MNWPHNTHNNTRESPTYIFTIILSLLFCNFFKNFKTSITPLIFNFIPYYYFSKKKRRTFFPSEHRTDKVEDPKNMSLIWPLHENDIQTLRHLSLLQRELTPPPHMPVQIRGYWRGVPQRRGRLRLQVGLHGQGEAPYLWLFFISIKDGALGPGRRWGQDFIHWKFRILLYDS